eukprot:TRINITY_DN65846_c2_g1_i2.p1 TRINITY_DN65846_c2_g1~~TRINITY_DN65846_c2_g1_i2.p1  ORF type:complete len:192 (+),score=90.31 TRINITY_DN65846_c2_g1_i2:108-683(+)
MTTMKIAVVGPRKSGKTRISNLLANELEHASYQPTVAVRVLETERDIHSVSRDGAKETDARVAVELWDCSGDQKYEQCWPAIMQDLHGLVVVFDPTSTAQANDVRLWVKWFCKHAKLQTGQAIIFALGAVSSRHKPTTVKLTDDSSIVVPIIGVNVQSQDKESYQQELEQEFKSFLGTVYPFHEDADFDWD